jgi:hypothetical protein
MNHKLFNQLVAAHPSENEITELYEDLRYVIESPFDTLIAEAVTNRGCAYIDQFQSLAN